MPGHLTLSDPTELQRQERRQRKAESDAYARKVYGAEGRAKTPTAAASRRRRWVARGVGSPPAARACDGNAVCRAVRDHEVESALLATELLHRETAKLQQRALEALERSRRVSQQSRPYVMRPQSAPRPERARPGPSLADSVAAEHNARVEALLAARDASAQPAAAGTSRPGTAPAAGEQPSRASTQQCRALNPTSIAGGRRRSAPSAEKDEYPPEAPVDPVYLETAQPPPPLPVVGTAELAPGQEALATAAIAREEEERRLKEVRPRVQSGQCGCCRAEPFLPWRLLQLQEESERRRRRAEEAGDIAKGYDSDLEREEEEARRRLTPEQLAAMEAEQQRRREQEEEERAFERWKEQDQWMDDYRLERAVQFDLESAAEAEGLRQQQQHRVGRGRSASASFAEEELALMAAEFIPRYHLYAGAPLPPEGPDGYSSDAAADRRSVPRRRVRDRVEGWVPQRNVTRPRPFSFAERDEARRKTLAQIKMEQQLALQAEEEEAARRLRGFRANPLPRSTLEPRFQAIMVEQALHAQRVRETRMHQLKCAPRPAPPVSLFGSISPRSPLP